MSDKENTMTKEIPSLHYDGDHFNLLTENDWWVGDVLEDADPDEKTRLRIKLTKVTTVASEIVTKDDRHENRKRDGTIELLPGHGRGVITFAEWPLGGSVSACALTCRNWIKVK